MAVLFAKKGFMGVHREIAVQRMVLEEHVPLHSHDFIELMYVISGHGQNIIAGESRRLCARDIVLMNSNLLHEYYNDVDAPLTMYHCLFLPGAIDDSLSDGSGSFIPVISDFLRKFRNGAAGHRGYIYLTDAPVGGIGDILEEMYEECSSERPGADQVLRADLTRLLVKFFRLYLEAGRSASDSKAFKKATVEHAVAYMRNNYRRRLTAGGMASMYYICPGYFRRIFAEQQGVSFARALRQTRMLAAARLLRDTTLPVAVIAANVGYSDIKTFYAAFRENMHTTPGEYRRRGEGDA